MHKRHGGLHLKRSLSSFFLILFFSFASSVSFAQKVSTREHPRGHDRLLKSESKQINYKDRGWALDLVLKQRADYFENALENSFRYRLEVIPDFKLKISDYFFVDASLGLGATVGSVQTRFGDLRANNFIRLRGARFFFRTPGVKKSFWSQLSLGAISQRDFLKGFSILMNRRALPGLEQKILFRNFYGSYGSYGLDLRLFEGVPASESLNLSFRERENTPFYYNGRLELFLKSQSPKFGYRFSVHAGIFDFSTLPSVIADESRLYGNTVQGFGPAAEFVFDYKGWYGGWRMLLSGKRYEFAPSVQILTNTEAPGGQNQGQMAMATLRLHDQNLNTWTIEPFSFFVEQDASVASYNSTVLGHNNREGFGMNLALNIKRRGLKLILNYVSSDVIEPDGDLQLPSDYYGLQLEYKNAL